MSNAAPRTAAMHVLRVLRKAGFEALFAGGCVRDRLLGLRSSDYDIASNATPEQVQKLFPHVLLVGAKFGVAMVIFNRKKVEVTTYRSDLAYQDGRRPSGVRFTDAREDALRRDFTINGMFYDPIARKVIDYVGGQDDLGRKVVRTIGPAQERFAEDYLRMIRAVRFAVRFDFAIDPATAAAIKIYAPNITSISGERVFEELTKMLERPSAAGALAKLAEVGLAQHIMPEMFGASETYERAIARVAALARGRDSALALAAMLAELPPAQIVRITRRWGASNELRDAVGWIAGHLNDWPRAGRAETMPLHDFKRIAAHGEFCRLQRLWRVVEKIQTGSQRNWSAIRRRLASIPADRLAPAPFVTGDDLKELGLSQGPQLGHILRSIYDQQLDEVLEDRQTALAQARRMI